MKTNIVQLISQFSKSSNFPWTLALTVLGLAPATMAALPHEPDLYRRGDGPRKPGTTTFTSRTRIPCRPTSPPPMRWGCIPCPPTEVVVPHHPFAQARAGLQTLFPGSLSAGLRAGDYHVHLGRRRGLRRPIAPRSISTARSGTPPGNCSTPRRTSRAARRVRPLAGRAMCPPSAAFRCVTGARRSSSATAFTFTLPWDNWFIRARGGVLLSRFPDRPAAVTQLSSRFTTKITSAART